jgi:hypothetical protein
LVRRAFGRFLSLLVLAACVPALSGNLGRLDRFEERALAVHNRERAALHIPPLSWDDNLAREAQAWARHLARSGMLDHSPDDPKNADPEGENLWAGTIDRMSVEQMIGDWIAEKQLFKPGIFPNNSRTGNFDDVGHYTQVMWRNTHKVGCAVASGEGFEFLVCRYAQGGNVIGERAF